MSLRNTMEHNPHEDDHSDDEREEHHHDAHSKHAHKHEEVKLASGGTLSINVFNDYPDHGKPHHLHTVPIRDDKGGVNYRKFYHEGALHTDVPKNHPHAWIFNDKRNMEFPCKGLASLAVSHDNHSPQAAKKSEPPMPTPSAPLGHYEHSSPPPAYEAHGFSMWDEQARTEAQRKQLAHRRGPASGREESEKEGFLCCRTM